MGRDRDMDRDKDRDKDVDSYADPLIEKNASKFKSNLAGYYTSLNKF
jgi:hypothetical protein